MYTGSKDLLKLIDDEKISVCILNKSGNIIYQNNSCLCYCGNQFGTFCQKNSFKICGDFPNTDSNIKQGMRLYKNLKVNKSLFDVTTISTKVYNSIISYQKDDELDYLNEQLDKYQLTKKEQKVLNCLIEGKSNNSISKDLNITENTLRTHIKSINKKIDPDLKEFITDLRKT
ncbi:MAG: helix-turn-helix transcriptional regulator [Bdellovibrionales bacterium]|nr:helix-turn-helix transcriptional regulator [Bdellovibrionales bacterium]